MVTVIGLDYWTEDEHCDVGERLLSKGSETEV